MAAPKKDKPPAGDVLVFNARSGFYECNEVTPLKEGELPTGVGKDDPASKYRVASMRLPPGLSFAPPEQWAKICENAGLQRRIADHQIVVVGGVGAPWETGWASIRARAKVEYIEHTADLEALQRLLGVEEDDKVAAEINAQIEACSDDQKAKLAARRAQRAHNRGVTGMRRRLN